MPKHNPIKKIINNKSSGQTLIETIVGIGLLTTGIIGGMALSIYSLGASDYSVKQVIAVNLAREGVEMVRNMRDTNWLNDTLTTGGNCDQIAGGQPCYPDWDDQDFNIAGAAGGTNYAINYTNFLNQNTWGISPITLGCQNRLYANGDGFYTADTRLIILCIPHFNSTANQYYRRITVIRDATDGFTAQNPRLLARSTVWWKGKRCPAPSDNPPAGNNCKVVVEEYLTNWKNY